MYYVATRPNIGSVEEVELQNILYDQPNEAYRRMVLLTDNEGYHSWHVSGYRPSVPRYNPNAPGYNRRGIIGIISSGNPAESPLLWSTLNGVKTFYSSELTKAYTDVSELTKPKRSEIENRSDFDLVGEEKKHSYRYLLIHK